MSQNDMVIANQTFPATRADINSAFQALASTSKGSSAPSTIYTGQHWIEDDLPSSTVWTEKVYDGVDHIPVQRIDTTNNRVIPYNAAHGHCKLTKSGTNLKLSPWDGNVLVINGAPEVIPSAGVTLTTATLLADTTYYIYTYLSGATLTLEASTTGSAVDSATGVTVKSGDVTRTLVGMARTNGSTAWVDTTAQRFVRSWFNDSGTGCNRTYTANRVRSTTTVGELDSEIRCQFLLWAGEMASFSVCGLLYHATAGNGGQTAIGIDSGSVTSPGYSINYSPSTNAEVPAVAECVRDDLAEGYHFATVLGALKGTGTTTWGADTALSVLTRR